MNLDLLEQYNILVIRYNSEIWLKSTKVKINMVKTLINNLKYAFKRNGVEFHKYKLSDDSTRIFFNLDNDQMSSAINAALNTFGVDSISPAVRSSNKVEHITRRALNVAQDILKLNDTFALRVKRSGEHPYSSKDVAIMVGQAINDHFKHLNLKVNLSQPLKLIYIEIRGNFSYIFTNIHRSKWVGLPIDNRKIVTVLDVGRVSDLIAGLMLAKRGCRFIVFHFDLEDNDAKIEDHLENWRQVLKFLPYSKIEFFDIKLLPILDFLTSKPKLKEYHCAFCRILRFSSAAYLLKKESFKWVSATRAYTDGLNFNKSYKCSDLVDLQSIRFNSLFSDLPIFTPLAGLTQNEISDIQNNVSQKLKSNRFCRFDFIEQAFDYGYLKSTIEELDLQCIIKEKLTYTKLIVKSNP